MKKVRGVEITEKEWNEIGEHLQHLIIVHKLGIRKNREWTSTHEKHVLKGKKQDKGENVKNCHGKKQKSDGISCKVNE